MKKKINHLGTKRLETERLILRIDTLEDMDKLWKYMFSDKEAVKKCDWVDFETLENFKSKFRDLSNKKDFYSWTIWLKEENIPIGGISLHHQDDINKTTSIGYSINPKYWNKGYATEMLKVVIDFLFNEVGYTKIIANTRIDNYASQKVLEKNGFKFVKINEKTYFHHGEYIDETVYELNSLERQKALLDNVNFM